MILITSQFEATHDRSGSVDPQRHKDSAARFCMSRVVDSSSNGTCPLTRTVAADRTPEDHT